MINMINTRDVVIALRNEKNVRKLSINNIVKLLRNMYLSLLRIQDFSVRNYND